MLFPLPYLSVAPQLVAFHAVTVVQGDGAVVGDGVETDFFCVHGVTHPDVLSPAECEHLQETNPGCYVEFFVILKHSNASRLLRWLTHTKVNQPFKSRQNRQIGEAEIMVF